MKSLGSTDLKRLHRSWRKRTSGSVSLLLDSVQGPYNVGSILRTAAAYRIDDVWLVGATPDADNSKVGKTAMGSGRFVTIHRSESVGDAADAVTKAGMSLVGVELAEGAGAAHETAYADKVCLVLGNEERGISPALLDRCDRVIYLPLLGRIGSLNVATAAALAMYEVRRQSWTS